MLTSEYSFGDFSRFIQTNYFRLQYHKGVIAVIDFSASNYMAGLMFSTVIFYSIESTHRSPSSCIVTCSENLKMEFRVQRKTKKSMKRNR